MTGVTLDDAKEARDEAQTGNLRENEAGVPEELAVDYDKEIIEDTKLHPEVLVTFDHIARVSIQDYGTEENILAMEQNLQGATVHGNPYGFDIELTVAGPEIVDGQLWEETDAEYPSHKVLGDPDDDGNPYELRENVLKDDDGSVTGAETKGVGDLPGGNSWDGQPVDEIDADYMTITISGSRGMDILGVLDTAGMWFTNQDGEVIEGLFETPPNFGTDAYDSDEDGYPRLTGYPELRADMVGQSGAIACTYPDDVDEPNTRSRIEMTLYHLEDDTLEALTSLSPQNDAFAKPTYPRVNNAFWDHDGDGVGADAEPQSSDGVSEAMDEMSEDSRTTYDDLTDDGQDLVDGVVDIMDEAGIESTADFEDPDFASRVEQEKVDNTINASAEELAQIIDGWGDA